MKKLTFLFKVFLSEAKKRNFILKSFFIAASYFVFSLLIINYQSYLSFLTSDYSILGKAKIVVAIFLGSFQIISRTDAVLITIISLLFGLNTELVFRKIKFLAGVGNLHLTFGAGLMSIASTGCASCGLSLASIVGLSAVLAALPFHGFELYALSILILIVSLLYNLQTLVTVCKIERV